MPTWEQGKVTKQTTLHPSPAPKGAARVMELLPSGLSQQSAGVKSELVCTCLVSAAFFLSPTPFTSHLLFSMYGFCFLFN